MTAFRLAAVVAGSVLAGTVLLAAVCWWVLAGLPDLDEGGDW